MAVDVVKPKGRLFAQPRDHPFGEVVTRGEICVVEMARQVQGVVERNVED